MIITESEYDSETALCGAPLFVRPRTGARHIREVRSIPRGAKGEIALRVGSNGYPSADLPPSAEMLLRYETRGTLFHFLKTYGAMPHLYTEKRGPDPAPKHK